MNTEFDNTKKQPKQDHKKNYASPKLFEYGSIADQTLAGGSGTGDLYGSGGFG